METFTAELGTHGFLINLFLFQVPLALLKNQRYRMSLRTLPLSVGRGQWMMVAVKSQDTM